MPFLRSAFLVLCTLTLGCSDTDLVGPSAPSTPPPPVQEPEVTLRVETMWMDSVAVTTLLNGKLATEWTREKAWERTLPWDGAMVGLSAGNDHDTSGHIVVKIMIDDEIVASREVKHAFKDGIAAGAVWNQPEEYQMEIAARVHRTHTRSPNGCERSRTQMVSLWLNERPHIPIPRVGCEMYFLDFTERYQTTLEVSRGWYTGLKAYPEADASYTMILAEPPDETAGQDRPAPVVQTRLVLFQGRLPENYTHMNYFEY